MKTVLIISSFVSASRVGATAAAFCLRRLGVEAIVLPTTLMGRHPGWGNPGGGATDPAQLEAMWDAIDAQDFHFDAVLTGYMGHIEHVNLAKDIIRAVKTENPEAIVMVDPVMGDAGALYIPKDRAAAIIKHLVPLADYLTPNLWELSYITGTDAPATKDIVKAIRSLAIKTLVTSMPDKEKIGALYVGEDITAQVSHQCFPEVPHGGGDSLAATFLANMLLGHAPIVSMEMSVASIFQIMSAADELDAGELPLVREQDSLVAATPLKSRILDL